MNPWVLTTLGMALASLGLGTWSLSAMRRSRACAKHAAEATSRLGGERDRLRQTLELLARNEDDMFELISHDGRAVAGGLVLRDGGPEPASSAPGLFPRVHPEDLPAAMGALATLKAGHAAQALTVRLGCEGGDWRWFELRLQETEWGTAPGGCVLLRARDVHERVLAEQRLAESEERFRQFSLLGETYLWETDTQDRLVYVSGSKSLLERLGGGSPLGRGRDEYSRAIGMDTTSAQWLAMRRHVAERTAWRESLDRLTLPDGSEAWIETSATPRLDKDGMFLGFRGKSRIATRLVQLERARSQSERILQVAMSSLSQGILMLGADGRVVIINDAAAQALGLPPELAQPGIEASRITAHAMAAGEYGPDWHGMLDKVHDGRYIPGVPVTYERRRPNGRLLEVNSLLMADGTFVRTYADITQRRHFEESLRDAQRLEVIGQMTGGLAHDFNNLLGVVLGNLDLIGARLPADDQLRQQHGAAVDAALRGAALTRALLATARRQPMALVRHNLNRLLRDLLPLMKASIGSSIALETEFDAQTLSVTLDETGLRNVVMNLLLNAREAFVDRQANCSIVLRTSTRWVGPEENGMSLAPGRYAVFEVCDNGSGMSEAVRARAFDPFFTTKPAGGGSGLGLSTVHGFAEQLGGTARIESEPGRGTTVSVYLPQEAGEPVSDFSATLPPVAQACASARSEVLVVDDEPGQCEVACAWLKALGCNATSALSPAQALQRLGERHFDLLFSDIAMPGPMDGIELGRRVRRDRPATRVLLTTGVQGSLGDGVTLPGPVLSKPYRKADLARALQACMRAPPGDAGVLPLPAG